MEQKGKILFIHAEGTRLGVSVRILFWPLSKSNVCCCDYMIFEKLGQMTPLTSARAHTRTHTNAHAHTNKTSLVACNPTRATFLFHHTRIIRRRRRHDVTHPWSGAVVVYSVCVCVCFRCCTLLHSVLCCTNWWTGRSCSDLWEPAGLNRSHRYDSFFLTRTNAFIFTVIYLRIVRVRFTQKALSSFNTGPWARFSPSAQGQHISIFWLRVCCITIFFLSEELIIKKNKFTNSLRFHGWLNKLILKDNTTSTTSVSLCLYVADPATFSSFKQCSEALFSSEKSSFVHLWIFQSLYNYLINIVKIKTQSLGVWYATQGLL